MSGHRLFFKLTSNFGHFWPYGQNRPTWASDISGYKHTNLDVKCLLESPYLPLQNEILHFYVAYI